MPPDHTNTCRASIQVLCDSPRVSSGLSCRRSALKLGRNSLFLCNWWPNHFVAITFWRDPQAWIHPAVLMPTVCLDHSSFSWHFSTGKCEKTDWNEQFKCCCQYFYNSNFPSAPNMVRYDPVSQLGGLRRSRCLSFFFSEFPAVMTINVFEYALREDAISCYI